MQFCFMNLPFSGKGSVCWTEKKEQSYFRTKLLQWQVWSGRKNWMKNCDLLREAKSYKNKIIFTRCESISHHKNERMKIGNVSWQKIKCLSTLLNYLIMHKTCINKLFSELKKVLRLMDFKLNLILKNWASLSKTEAL